KELTTLNGKPFPNVVVTPKTKKEEEDEFRIRGAPRPYTPTKAVSPDRADELLTHATPSLGADIRAKALKNLRVLPMETAHSILGQMDAGKVDALVTWLATDGTGELLSAFKPYFLAEFIDVFNANADDNRALILSIAPATLRYWYQSGWEKTTRDNGVKDFLE